MILVDTGPLVALADAHDRKHRTAVKHLESLADEAFAVCDAVLTEAAFHLPHVNQRQRLRALLEELAVQSLPATHEPGWWEEIFHWLVKYADHQPDWADANLAVLSGRDGTLRIWTYDREFRTVWRRPNGTIIPLAVRST